MVVRRPITDAERPNMEDVCQFAEPTGLYTLTEVCDIIDQILAKCADGDSDRQLRAMSSMTISEMDALLNGKPRYDPQNNPADLARMMEIRAASALEDK